MRASSSATSAARAARTVGSSLAPSSSAISRTVNPASRAATISATPVDDVRVVHAPQPVAGGRAQKAAALVEAQRRRCETRRLDDLADIKHLSSHDSLLT
jgi:hypothetical protein